ncbi:MAG TPA: LamG domain-containing protein, partial [Thermoleophilaceae bacterium]
MKRLALLLATAVLALAPTAAHASTVIHWWKADGNANDSVGTNNGSLVDDTTFAAGENGQAFSFDGDGDYVSVPDDPSHYFTGSFTMEAWGKTSGTNEQQVIAAIYECGNFCPTNAANSAVFLQLFQNQAYGFVRDAAGNGPNDGGQDVQGGPEINDGVFHHLVLIRDVTAMKLALYVDGTEVDEEDLDPGAAGALANEDSEADPMTIGGHIEGGATFEANAFTGLVDDVKLSTTTDYPDTTAPVVSPAVSGPLGKNGWYVGNVTVGWNIATHSFVRSQTGCDPVVVTTDTGGGSFSCHATTVAGSGSSSTTVKRDATPPTVTCSSPAPTFAVGASGKQVAASVSDALSGPASTKASAAASTSSAGKKTVTVSGTDLAGNVGTASCPYTVAQQTSVAIKSLKRCLPTGPFTYRFKVPLKKLQGGKKVNRR